VNSREDKNKEASRDWGVRLKEDEVEQETGGVDGRSVFPRSTFRTGRDRKKYSGRMMVAEIHAREERREQYNQLKVGL
jgi:hypothetical protein